VDISNFYTMIATMLSHCMWPDVELGVIAACQLSSFSFFIANPWLFSPLSYSIAFSPSATYRNSQFLT